MVEDELGRVMHDDDVLGAEQLVTGCNVVVLGLAGTQGF